MQASADMASLYSLLPSSARLLVGSGSETRDVPANAVTAGDVIRVLPGDRLPVDGTVLDGRTTIDESALTGEPMPVTKCSGDAVTAGTVNVDGALQRSVAARTAPVCGSCSTSLMVMTDHRRHSATGFQLTVSCGALVGGMLCTHLLCLLLDVAPKKPRGQLGLATHH
jgi:P-type E1-E2 ATPase